MPKEAALSDEPWPTMRTSRASRVRTISAMRPISASCSSRRRSAAGCSRISARKRVPGSAPFSAGDKALTANEGANDLEGVVEDDDVGGAARRQAYDRRVAQEARGHAGRRLERTLERHVDRDEVSHRFDHRQRTA